MLYTEAPTLRARPAYRRPYGPDMTDIAHTLHALTSTG